MGPKRSDLLTKCLKTTIRRRTSFSKSSTSASALPEVKNDEKVDDPSPTHAAYTKMLNDHKKGNDACCTRGQIKTSGLGFHVRPSVHSCHRKVVSKDRRIGQHHQIDRPSFSCARISTGTLASYVLHGQGVIGLINSVSEYGHASLQMSLFPSLMKLPTSQQEATHVSHL